MIINENLAKMVKDTVSFGLCKGKGVPSPGEMCVEAAVNYACGLPHSDNPSCVGSSVRDFKIDLNDCQWSSNQARGEGMLRIAIAQLGSNTIDQLEFGKMIAFRTMTILMPIIFRDNGFEEYAVRCESYKDINDILNDVGRINSTNMSSEVYNSLDHAYLSNKKVMMAVLRGSKTSNYSVVDAAIVGSGHSEKYGDKYLLISADICLSVLKDLMSPGCEFLYVCDK